MTPESAVAYYSTLLSKWWTETWNVSSVAIDSIRKKTYKADDLALDVGRTWLNNVDALFGLIPPPSAPLLPTVYIHETLSSYTGGKPPRGHVFVRSRLPLAPAPKSTDLVRQGGSSATVGDVIPIAKVDLKVQTQGTILQVELKTPPPAGLKKGMYEGAVRVDEVPIAVVFAELY